MDLIDANAAVLLSFGDLRSVVVEDAIKMATALGMPLEVLQGIMTLFNHAQVESVPKINTMLDGIKNPGLGGMGIEYSNSHYDKNRAAFDLFKAHEFKNRHIGGAVKPSGSYMVGELGPEVLKMNPSGGGYINRLGQGSSAGMSQNNVVNVNVTGLPSDPIASRRIAQNIQRELNKLSKDGRSGSVR